MSIVVLHLRWDRLTPDQQDAARGRLEGLAQRVPGGACYSSSCRRAGDAVLATVVWADEERAGAFTRDLTTARAGEAALPRPQTVAFGVPELFAVGYRRPVATVPGQRAAADAAATALA